MADDSIQVNCPHCGAAVLAGAGSGEIVCAACGAAFVEIAAPRPPAVESAQLSRHAAQQRADDIRVFRRELARLEEEGALQLSVPQRQALTAHHDGLLAGFARAFDIDRDSRAKQLSWGMRIASFLGALALAASVFFLFYQFWGGFTEAVQVGILVGASLGLFVLTMVIQTRDATGYFTKIAALVAFACFVLNVSMLGQIFNLAQSDKAFLAWAAYALLLAYACDLRLLLAAGILCLIAFTAARVGTWSGVYWIHFGQRPENFFPVALALFCLPQFLIHRHYEDFPPIYRIFGLLALFLPVLVLSHWGAASYLNWDVATMEGLYQVAGFALAAGAIWLGLKRQWPETVNTAVTFFVIFLYTKFFDWWWNLMPKYLFFLVLGLTAVLGLMVIKRLRRMAGKAAGEAA
ncbi:MAG TPA: DUF2157 domain-containing protein [Azospira sp.]|nr:DUF2157 domain-containing protein [Azospira sp.]